MEWRKANGVKAASGRSLGATPHANNRMGSCGCSEVPNAPLGAYSRLKSAYMLIQEESVPEFTQECAEG
jgi:hypothetical protein